MFLCENTIYSQRNMEDVLTHELIHAYDNCRIKYDAEDVRMLACTEVFALFLFKTLKAALRGTLYMLMSYLVAVKMQCKAGTSIVN